MFLSRMHSEFLVFYRYNVCMPDVTDEVQLLSVIFMNMKKKQEETKRISEIITI